MQSIAFGWLLGTILSFIHPFYISMTEINHNKNNKTIEVSVRIFTDDLEKAMRKEYPGKVDLMNSGDTANSDKRLKDYIARHLMLKADGKAITLNFIGFETEDGSTWSYFEARGIAAMSIMEVTNNILYGYQNRQINFIHIKANHTDETEKFDYPDSYRKFILN